MGSILPFPRKRKNELEKGQDQPKDLPVKKKKLECTVKVPTPTLCTGVTLQLSQKFCGNQTHSMSFFFLYPAPSWCKVFHGKREEETIKSQGKAPAGEHHQQVSPWIGMEVGFAGLGFSSWVIPELCVGMLHPALLSLCCSDYQVEFLIGKK